MKADEHRAWLVRMARESDREVLRRARAAVKAARDHRRSASARARHACREARSRVRIWAAHERVRVRVTVAAMRAELKREIEAAREKVRHCCGPDKERIKAEGTAALERAQLALGELKNRRAREQLWSRQAPKLAKVDQQRESDSAVEAELSHDELIVWRKVKGQIKASARMSRYEAFQHWVHDHQGEVAGLLEEQAQRELDKLIKQEQRQRKELRAMQHARAPLERLRRHVAGVVSDVPF